MYKWLHGISRAAWFWVFYKERYSRCHGTPSFQRISGVSQTESSLDFSQLVYFKSSNNPTERPSLYVSLFILHFNFHLDRNLLVFSPKKRTLTHQAAAERIRNNASNRFQISGLRAGSSDLSQILLLLLWDLEALKKKEFTWSCLLWGWVFCSFNQSFKSASSLPKHVFLFHPLEKKKQNNADVNTAGEFFYVIQLKVWKIPCVTFFAH